MHVALGSCTHHWLVSWLHQRFQLLAKELCHSLHGHTHTRTHTHTHTHTHRNKQTNKQTCNEGPAFCGHPHRIACFAVSCTQCSTSPCAGSCTRHCMLLHAMCVCVCVCMCVCMCARIPAVCVWVYPAPRHQVWMTGSHWEQSTELYRTHPQSKCPRHGSSCNHKTHAPCTTPLITF